jgi:putative PIG3 family NAD(P)H quinone oxidoreductase
MRAIVVKDGRMELGDVAEPVLRPDDLLIAVKATGVNRADLLQRVGKYPPPPGEPETIGLELAGEVIEPAARRGERVMALVAGGGYAERARVPAAQAMPIPQGLSFAEAAAIPEVFLTAWLNLMMIGKLEPGEVVVVHAAASGVGTAALQICRGVAKVILATASPNKHEACRALGATHVLARQEVAARLADAVQSAAGRGADLIFDLVGAGYLEPNLAALALHGRLLCISTMGGSRGTLDFGQLVGKRLTVMGSSLRTRTAAQKAKLVADFSRRALPRFESGELKPVLAKMMPLADAQAAHEALQRNEVVGKVVLVV